MSGSLPNVDWTGLSGPQRLELIAQLWDSFDDEGEPVPEWHREELQRRTAAADRDPSAAIPWEDLLAQLRSKS